jgi:sulfatase modifying factor 1
MGELHRADDERRWPRGLPLIGAGVAILLIATCAPGSGGPPPQTDAGADGGSDGGDAGDGSAQDGAVPDGGSADGSSDGSTDGSTDGGAQDGGDGDAGEAEASAPCPAGMAHVLAYCIERWVADVVEVDDGGTERPHSPYYVIDAGVTVRAKAAPGVAPQGYISQLQASAACANAGKRLCTKDEFSRACEGPDAGNWYPYGGEVHEAGACNEGKGSTMVRFFGSDPTKWTYAEFNDPRLNEWDGGLAPTAAFAGCESPDGIFDLVGNLHEWGADPADSNGHGRFRGGFYGDAEINGHGCLYVTSAHELAYHDYSTGFRCCCDAK